MLRVLVLRAFAVVRFTPPDFAPPLAAFVPPLRFAAVPLFFAAVVLVDAICVILLVRRIARAAIRCTPESQGKSSRVGLRRRVLLPRPLYGLREELPQIRTVMVCW